MSITQRPWGTYTVIYETPLTKVKEINVKPGQTLSYQSHSMRKEDWIITKGKGFVVLDGERFEVNEGDHIRIEAGVKHRVGTEEADSLIFIEVQTGTYFGEDDIVRYEDVYGRS